MPVLFQRATGRNTRRYLLLTRCHSPIHRFPAVVSLPAWPGGWSAARTANAEPIDCLRPFAPVIAEASPGRRYRGDGFH